LDIKKSFKVACAKKGMTTKDVAAIYGVTPRAINITINRKKTNIYTIQRLADAFGMKASEFIALGED